jgi:hypothetical protein
MVQTYTYKNKTFQVSKNLNNKYNVLDLNAKSIIDYDFDLKADAIKETKLLIDLFN